MRPHNEVADEAMIHGNDRKVHPPIIRTKPPVLLTVSALAALPAAAQSNHSQLFFDASGTDQAVVDEAHHSFQGQGQAAAFYNEVLAPDYTVLITATPDDKDIEKWKKSCGVAEVQRISVSRSDAVEAGLVKAGVKCISFVPDPASEGLVDMELTCLRCATGVHADIKAQLKTAGVSQAPLMLVQVDSKRKDSVARAKAKLMQLGWAEENIAIHTAEEPDAGLLALANDEDREVLIFKMAVALGFDAPRAFTLVSMRAAKDEDFGVQLLGRILRVHRRLHGKGI